MNSEKLYWAIGAAVPRGLLVALWLLIVLGPPMRVDAVGQSYTATLHGRIVQAAMSGFEPDFDPIYRLIISTTLHDQRGALPDSMLILSLYLENFQPGTTPELPDLLDPNHVATNLGGFMQGKVVLATGRNHIRFRGSLLAEVFLDNSVHLIVDLNRAGAPETTPALRLKGHFTLHKDYTLVGTVSAVRGLTPPEVAALQGPRDGTVSWQTIVRGLAVSRPPMMGTMPKASA